MQLHMMNRFSARDRSDGIALAWQSTREVYAGMERVVELNVQTVKTTLAEQHALAQAALSSQSLDEVIDLQTQQVPAAVTKHFAYWRHVGEIAAQTQSELFGLVQDHVNHMMTTLTKLADTAADETAVAGERLIAGDPLVEQPATPPATGPAALVDSAGNALH